MNAQLVFVFLFRELKEEIFGAILKRRVISPQIGTEHLPRRMEIRQSEVWTGTEGNELSLMYVSEFVLMFP